MKQTNKEKELEIKVKNNKEKIDDLETKCYNLRSEYEKKKDRLLFMYFVSVSLLLMLIGGVFIHYNPDRIDENSYCLDKLNTYFPEYNFTKAEYVNENQHPHSCKGTINNDEKVRDGLKEEGNKEEYKYFKLINENEVDAIYFMNGGTFRIFGMFLFGGGAILGGLIILFLLSLLWGKVGQ